MLPASFHQAVWHQYHILTPPTGAETHLLVSWLYGQSSDVLTAAATQACCCCRFLIATLCCHCLCLLLLLTTLAAAAAGLQVKPLPLHGTSFRCGVQPLLGSQQQALHMLVPVHCHCMQLSSTLKGPCGLHPLLQLGCCCAQRAEGISVTCSTCNTQGSNSDCTIKVSAATPCACSALNTSTNNALNLNHNPPPPWAPARCSKDIMSLLSTAPPPPSTPTHPPTHPYPPSYPPGASTVSRCRHCTACWCMPRDR